MERRRAGRIRSFPTKSNQIQPVGSRTLLVESGTRGGQNKLLAARFAGCASLPKAATGEGKDGRRALGESDHFRPNPTCGWKIKPNPTKSNRGNAGKIRASQALSPPEHSQSEAVKPVWLGLYIRITNDLSGEAFFWIDVKVGPLRSRRRRGQFGRGFGAGHFYGGGLLSRRDGQARV